MILLLLIITEPHAIIDYVDVVEINHKYSDDGLLAFDQIIWYDWNYDHYDVVDWRMLKNVRGPIDEKVLRNYRAQPEKFEPPEGEWLGGHAVPIKDNGIWISRWYDKGKMREVRAKYHRETWTLYDVDIMERENLPEEERRKLTK
jgi:hypothetical protein